MRDDQLLFGAGIEPDSKARVQRPVTESPSSVPEVPTRQTPLDGSYSASFAHGDANFVELIYAGTMTKPPRQTLHSLATSKLART